MSELLIPMDTLEIWIMIAFCAAAVIVADVLQDYINRKKERCDGNKLR